VEELAGAHHRPAQTLMAAIRSQSNAIEPIEYADPQAALEALERRAGYAVVGSTDAGGGTGLTLTAASASSPTAVDFVVQTLTGIGGALVTGPILGIFTEHRPGLAIAGSLIVFASALVAAFVQGWLGLLGTGLVIFLLVVLGHPGSGGSYAPEFLPSIFRSMHRWNVPGLGVDLVTSVVYFDRKAAGWPVTALTLWALLGVGGLLGATAALGRRAHR
jgi:hypothetical protein